MFNSLNGGYIPICLIVILAAWFISRIKPILFRIFLALLVPLFISLAWYIVPDLFRSLPDRRDPSWLAWGFIAAATWSIVAVPVSIITVYISSFIRKRATKIES